MRTGDKNQECGSVHCGDGQIPIIWGQIDCGGNDTTTENDSFVKSYQVNNKQEKTNTDISNL